MAKGLVNNIRSTSLSERYGWLWRVNNSELYRIYIEYKENGPQIEKDGIYGQTILNVIHSRCEESGELEKWLFIQKTKELRKEAERDEREKDKKVWVQRLASLIAGHNSISINKY